MVDAAEGGHVDGLAAHGAGGADARGVFARAAVDDGVDGDLNGVLVRHDVDLLKTWLVNCRCDMMGGVFDRGRWLFLRGRNIDFFMWVF